jgi:hypothetical protein
LYTSNVHLNLIVIKVFTNMIKTMNVGGHWTSWANIYVVPSRNSRKQQNKMQLPSN